MDRAGSILARWVLMLLCAPALTAGFVTTPLGGVYRAKLRASLYPCVGSRAVSLPGAWPVLRAKVNDDDFDISKMTLEEIEALPELGQDSSVDRPPMVEEIMEEDLRFGMKMRALRGDFTPANPVEDTEAGPSLAAAIMPFPGMVEMRVVVKRRGAGTALEPTPVPDIVHLLNCVPGVKVLTHSETERMNGKFISCSLNCLVQSAQARGEAFEALGADDRVAMRF